MNLPKNKLTNEKIDDHRFHGERVELVCPICDKQFSRLKCEVTRPAKRFCSFECRQNDIHSRAGERISKCWQDPEFVAKQKENVLDNNPNWKGDDAGYGAKHRQMYRHHGKASECENCHIKNATRYEWANLSGKYIRERSDYMQLCKKCHLGLDRSRPIWTNLIHQAEIKARLNELVKLKKAHSIAIFDEYLENHIEALEKEIVE